jgi:hypothetical protein
MGVYQRHLVVKGAEEVKDKNTTLANVQTSVMLHVIFPRTSRLPNIMGPGLSFDSGDMIGFALFWVAGLFLSS